jgi:hypothetical protein
VIALSGWKSASKLTNCLRNLLFFDEVLSGFPEANDEVIALSSDGSS